MLSVAGQTVQLLRDHDLCEESRTPRIGTVCPLQTASRVFHCLISFGSRSIYELLPDSCSHLQNNHGIMITIVTIILLTTIILVITPLCFSIRNGCMIVMVNGLHKASACLWHYSCICCCDHWVALQVPDAEKRERGDYVIDTGCSLHETEQQVVQLIQQLQGMTGTAAVRLLERSKVEKA